VKTAQKHLTKNRTQGDLKILCPGLSKWFFSVPQLATCIFLFFYNEPELGVGIDPGMALTPLPSSIGQGSNPQPSDCEPSALPLDHSFRYGHNMYFTFWLLKGQPVIGNIDKVFDREQEKWREKVFPLVFSPELDLFSFAINQEQEKKLRGNPIKEI